MALTRISGNQIADTTEAVITTLSFLNTNSVFRLPTGTAAQRPAGVSLGTMRFNTTADSAEVYANDDGSGNPGWIEVGAGGAVVGDKGQIRCNNDTIEAGKRWTVTKHWRETVQADSILSEPQERFFEINDCSTSEPRSICTC